MDTSQLELLLNKAEEIMTKQDILIMYTLLMRSILQICDAETLDQIQKRHMQLIEEIGIKNET